MTKSDLQRQLKTGPDRPNKLGDVAMRVVEYEHIKMPGGVIFKFVKKSGKLERF